jgi:hypothetical protein
MVAEFEVVADDVRPEHGGERASWRREPSAQVIYRGDTMTVHGVEARTTGIEFFNYSDQAVQKFVVAELQSGTTAETFFEELRNGSPASGRFLGGTAALATSGSRRDIAAARMDEDRPRYVANVEPLRYGRTYLVFEAQSDKEPPTYASFRP